MAEIKTIQESTVEPETSTVINSNLIFFNAENENSSTLNISKSSLIDESILQEEGAEESNYYFYENDLIADELKLYENELNSLKRNQIFQNHVQLLIDYCDDIQQNCDNLQQFTNAIEEEHLNQNNLLENFNIDTENLIDGENWITYILELGEFKKHQNSHHNHQSESNYWFDIECGDDDNEQNEEQTKYYDDLYENEEIYNEEDENDEEVDEEEELEIIAVNEFNPNCNISDDNNNNNNNNFELLFLKEKQFIKEDLVDSGLGGSSHESDTVESSHKTFINTIKNIKRITTTKSTADDDDDDEKHNKLINGQENEQILNNKSNLNPEINQKPNTSKRFSNIKRIEQNRNIKSKQLLFGYPYYKKSKIPIRNLQCNKPANEENWLRYLWPNDGYTSPHCLNSQCHSILDINGTEKFCSFYPTTTSTTETAETTPASTSNQKNLEKKINLNKILNKIDETLEYYDKKIPISNVETPIYYPVSPRCSVTNQIVGLQRYSLNIPAKEFVS